MNILDMARYEPQLAVHTWHALNRWRETYGLQGLDGEGPRRRNALRQPTLREALRVYGPDTLRRQLADSGVPAPVLAEVFDGGRRRNVRPERVKKMVRALNRHLLLTRQRCFEAIANLNAEDDAAVLTVAGIDP